jgi:hypothetical protein
MNINPNFMHEDQKFKLVYGSTNTIWETATLDDDVDPKTIHDGLWLTKNADGKWELATDTALAYPVLEMKYQYDNQAVNAVTIARGAVPAITTVFDYDGEEGYPDAPAKGQLLKVSNGVLVPVAEDGTEDHLYVAIVEEVYPLYPDRILIIKRY